MARALTVPACLGALGYDRIDAGCCGRRCLLQRSNLRTKHFGKFHANVSTGMTSVPMGVISATSLRVMEHATSLAECSIYEREKLVQNQAVIHHLRDDDASSMFPCFNNVLGIL